MKIEFQIDTYIPYWVILFYLFLLFGYYLLVKNESLLEFSLLIVLLVDGTPGSLNSGLLLDEC